MNNPAPDLLERAKQGDETAMAALIARMMPAVRRGAAVNEAPGLDYDDAVQEGLIGLFKAIRNYRPEQGNAFVAYAAACIANAQRDARRAALCRKHAPLNFSVPLPETLAQPGPEELTIANEELANAMERIRKELSTTERDALLANLMGYTSTQAARLLGRTPKAVESALDRARRKLRSTS